MYREIFANATKDVDWLLNTVRVAPDRNRPPPRAFLIRDHSGQKLEILLFQRREPVFLNRPDKTIILDGSAAHTVSRWLLERFPPR